MAELAIGKRGPRFSLELPREMVETIDTLAAAEERSRNAQITVLLGEALQRRRTAQ